MGSVGEPRIVLPTPAGAEPASLEQRADDIPTVTDDVDEHGLWKPSSDRLCNVGRLGRLLDTAEVTHESKPPRDAQDAADPWCSLGRCEVRELRDGGFQRGDLTEIDEARCRADRAGQEGGPGTGAAEHEDHPLLERADCRAERRRALPGNPACRAELKGGGAKRVLHGGIVS